MQTHELPEPIEEGWGLTSAYINGLPKFFVTDGTNKVYVVDPEDWSVEDIIEITNDEGYPIDHLNDIEFYKGHLLANIYLRTGIGVIDLNLGKIERYTLFLKPSLISKDISNFSIYMI